MWSVGCRVDAIPERLRRRILRTQPTLGTLRARLFRASGFGLPRPGFYFLFFISGFQISGFRFRDPSLGFEVFRVVVFFWISGFGFRASGFGLRVSGSGVEDLGCKPAGLTDTFAARQTARACEYAQQLSVHVL